MKYILSYWTDPWTHYWSEYSTEQDAMREVKEISYEAYNIRIMKAETIATFNERSND